MQVDAQGRDVVRLDPFAADSFAVVDEPVLCFRFFHFVRFLSSHMLHIDRKEETDFIFPLHRREITNGGWCDPKIHVETVSIIRRQEWRVQCIVKVHHTYVSIAQLIRHHLFIKNDTYVSTSNVRNQNCKESDRLG